MSSVTMSGDIQPRVWERQVPEEFANFGKMPLQAIKSTLDYQNMLKHTTGIEKTELHLHFSGAVPLSWFTGQASHDLEHLVEQIQAGNQDYNRIIGEGFAHVYKAVNSIEKVQSAAKALAVDHAERKVSYVELRTGLRKLGDTSYEDYLQAIINGLDEGIGATGTQIKLILSLRRDTSYADAMEYVRLAQEYPEHVVGFDISGNVLQGDGRQIAEALKDTGFPITLHIGEKKDETEKQQLWELETFKPARIGHAVHLSPAAAEWILRNQPIVEVCIQSAVLTKMIEIPGEHPGLEFLKQGLRVCFCSDDPLFFGNKEEDLALAAVMLGLKREEATQLENESQHFKFMHR